MSNAHAISNFLDTVKEKLNDAEYKEGMELCKTAFETTTKVQKTYNMVYLRPSTELFLEGDCTCECEIGIGFDLASNLVQLTDSQAECINKHHCYNLYQGQDNFVERDVFKSISAVVGNEHLVFWKEVPVISITLVE